LNIDENVRGRPLETNAVICRPCKFEGANDDVVEKGVFLRKTDIKRNEANDFIGKQ
jgi:hypothetical protein